MENPIEMDDLGVPLFSETSISQTTPQKTIHSKHAMPFQGYRTDHMNMRRSWIWADAMSILVTSRAGGVGQGR